MATIQEIIQRALSLKNETALDSISPDRAGGIMYDTLLYINQMQLQESNPLLISKIYASVAAMEADSAPVSDLTGRNLVAGQVVCIVTGDPDDPDEGVVYRYDGTTGGTSSWTAVGKIGNVDPVDSLDSDSATLPLAAHQGKVLDGKISQLQQNAAAIASTSASSFNFNRILNKWHLVVNAAGLNIDLKGVNVNNPSAIDITLNSSWYFINVDSSGNIYAEDNIPSGHYCIGRVYGGNPAINSLRFPYSIDGKPYNVDTSVPVWFLSVSAKRFTFTKVSDSWHLIVAAGSAGIYANGTVVNNVAADLTLTGTWKNINIDSSGNLYAEDSIPSGHYCIGRVLATNPLLNSLQCPYNIEGEPYGVTTPLIASKPESISFKNVAGTLHLVAGAGAANFYILGKSVNNVDTDIIISNGLKNIFVKEDGTFVASDASYVSGGYLVGRLYSYGGNVVTINAKFPYNIDGKPFGINGVEIGFSSRNNEPIIPNEIYVLDDAETTLYRKSMLLKPQFDCDMVLSTTVNSRNKSFDVANPLRIKSTEIGDSAKITVEKNVDLTTNIFKNISVNKGIVANKSGKTPKIIMIGDSITHGDNGAQSSPIVKMSELLPSRYSVTPTMIGTFAPYSVPGEGRGCFSFQAMAGIDNNPYGRYHFPSVGGSLEGQTPSTTQFQNPFTFPATAQDLQDHPEWCFTNSNNYSGETDGVSYADATAEQKANWHFFIFDFARYIGLWNDAAHTPDIITIALGTNDWWPSTQIDIEKTLFAIDIIYQQIRTALPSVKIGFVSANNIATTFQSDSDGNWETEIAPLLLNIQKKIRGWRSTDSNVHEIPIYANGCRWLAFDGHTAGTPQDLSSSNTTQKQTIDANVHLLDGVGSAGYWEYMDSIITAIMCMIDD